MSRNAVLRAFHKRQLTVEWTELNVVPMPRLTISCECIGDRWQANASVRRRRPLLRLTRFCISADAGARSVIHRRLTEPYAYTAISCRSRRPVAVNQYECVVSQVHRGRTFATSHNVEYCGIDDVATCRRKTEASSVVSSFHGCIVKTNKCTDWWLYLGMATSSRSDISVFVNLK